MFVLRGLRFGYAQNFTEFVQERLAIGTFGCAGLLPAGDEIRDAERGFGHEMAPRDSRLSLFAALAAVEFSRGFSTHGKLARNRCVASATLELRRR